MLPRFSRKGAYRPLVDAEPAAAYFRRHILLLFVGVTTTAACIFLYTAQLVDLWTSIEDPPPPGTRLPPLYSDYHASELQLPQQDWGRTSPADDEKFFFVAGHVRGLGWGNALQEHLLNAYLAYHSRRTFVFDNYTWNDDGSLYSRYNTHYIPSQIPYTAIIRGPSVGDSFPIGDDAPEAVTKEYFDHVCRKKVEKDRRKVHASLSPEESAENMVERWTHELGSTSSPCVQSSKKSSQIFTHHHIFGVRNSLVDIWPAFAASPIITHFRWSPLVERAFDLNNFLFLPPSSTESFLTSSPIPTNAERYPVIPGLMVIHIRRGDYLEHCRNLADRLEDFVSVNTFPGLPDPFPLPDRHGLPRGQAATAGPATAELYRARCFPSVDEIVAKVAAARASPAGRGVRRLYVMTNGDRAFVAALEAALWARAEWELVASSRDLVLDWEQTFVAQAVDQLVAQRAQVFIGNGFSTLTSDAVMMRLANGLDPQSNRFW